MDPQVNPFAVLSLIAAPAILITSHSSPSLRERARTAGVPIVKKPLLGNALLDKIRDVVAEPR